MENLLFLGVPILKHIRVGRRQAGVCLPQLDKIYLGDKAESILSYIILHGENGQSKNLKLIVEN